MEALPGVIFIAVLLVLGYALYRGAVWAERDALLRGKSPLLVKCAVLLFFPWGLIAWLLFRPEPVDQDGRSALSFDLNDFREQ